MIEDIQAESDNEFVEKVYVLADEVIEILKKLSRDNQKQQINTKIIAEKMYRNGLVKDMLLSHCGQSEKTNSEIHGLREISKNVLDKISTLMPSSMSNEFKKIKNESDLQSISKGSSDWLDSPINFVKMNIDSMGGRINELEEFIKLTSSFLADTEEQIVNELNLQQEIFEDYREFNHEISDDMNMIKQDISVSGDLDQLKQAVLSKIDKINKGIEKKKSQDMSRLEKTEKTLKEMEQKMRDIRQETDELRKRSNMMEHESLHDGLTGLYNRKAYDQKITETLADLERYQVPATLIICDIDYFKKINDTLGHSVGDLALKKLASLFKEKLKNNDFVARFGGEEFAIILRHTNLDNARKVGERIRALIDNALFSYKNNNILLTVSLGISSFKKDDNSDTVFKRADKALYAAKKAGRNNVKTEDDVSVDSMASV